MKILKAKNKIDGYETLVAEVDKLDFGHCAIDAPGFVKLYNSINETMMWPLILKDGNLKYGNKRLTYAKMLGYTHIEVVNINDDEELERVRVLTCWKRV
mgnify:FL=1|tara:strand:+ start:62 stop:358 length:297 start_codon:yes stop_codon:yes gene_type:complete